MTSVQLKKKGKNWKREKDTDAERLADWDICWKRKKKLRESHSISWNLIKLNRMFDLCDLVGSGNVSKLLETTHSGLD